MNKKYLIILAPLLTIVIVIGILLINKNPKNNTEIIDNNEVLDYEKEIIQDNIIVENDIAVTDFKYIFKEKRYFLEMTFKNNKEENISLENYYIRAYDESNNLLYEHKTNIIKPLEPHKKNSLELEVDEKIINVKTIKIEKEL